MPKISFTVTVDGDTTDACGRVYQELCDLVAVNARYGGDDATITVGEPDYGGRQSSSPQMAKVFYAMAVTEIGLSPGWYYQIDMETARGPFQTKRLATQAARYARNPR